MSTVKSRPILFSGPMVRAILEGRKSQTRRIVKPQPPGSINELHGGELSKRAPYDIEDDEQRVFGWGFQGDDNDYYKFPYGKIGDRLWVRETFAVCADCNIFYRADGKPDPLDGVKWKPSIFMPRKASRLTLEIIGVRVERLKDISEKDANAEGFGVGAIIKAERFECRYMSAGQYAFACLWDAINGEGSWKQNPWVWVVEFKKVTQ